MTDEFVRDEHVTVPGSGKAMVDRWGKRYGVGVKGGREVSSVVPQLPKDIPVSDDEFQKVLTDKESLAPESMKQNERVEYVATHSEHVHRYKSDKPTRVNLAASRRRDKNTKATGFVPDSYGVEFAQDREHVQKLLAERKRQKPNWAVRALVLLRDEGVCQVCHDPCYMSGDVVMRKPYKEGGQYDEYNCVTLCPDCMGVWSKYKNFYHSGIDEYDKARQYLWVLKRRAFGKKGGKTVKILSDIGMQRYREVMGLVETLGVRRDVLEEQRIQNVARVLDTRGMTQDERVMAILSPLRNRNIKLSENDNNGTEGEESTD